MLRITTLEANGAVTLKLEGRVVGPWVDVLREHCESILTRESRVDLDLADILFIDSSGVALLRQLTTRQVALTNCSPFTAQQLRS
jgi:ABC-type transporter Mla MlaB component